MNTFDFWNSKLNSGARVSISKKDLIQTQWYDGLEFGHLEWEGGAFLVKFLSEDNKKTRRMFLGYYLSSKTLSLAADREILISWMSKMRTQYEWKPDEFNSTTARIFSFRKSVHDYVVMEADPAFAEIFNSDMVRADVVESNLLKLEDFYLLSGEGRNAIHKSFTDLLQ